MFHLNKIILFVFSLIFSEEAFSLPQYQHRIPNGAITGPFQFNSFGHFNPVTTSKNQPISAFGRDFKNAGFVWTQNLCNTDSDGDNFTNGVELGDPDCVWGAVDGEFVFQSNPADDTSVPGDAHLDLPKYDQQMIIYIHGAAMMFSWGVLIPLAIVQAMTQKFRNNQWFKLHKNFALLAATLTILSFLVISYFGAGFNVKSSSFSAKNGRDFVTVIRNSNHAKLGITVVCGCVFQVFNALLRPHFNRFPGKEEDFDLLDENAEAFKAPVKTKGRIAWETIHVAVGRMTFVVSVFAITTGIKLGFANITLDFLRDYYQIVAYLIYAFYVILMTGAALVAIVNRKEIERVHAKFDELIGDAKSEVGKGGAFYHVIGNLDVQKAHKNEMYTDEEDTEGVIFVDETQNQQNDEARTSTLGRSTQKTYDDDLPL